MCSVDAAFIYPRTDDDAAALVQYRADELPVATSVTLSDKTLLTSYTGARRLACWSPGDCRLVSSSSSRGGSGSGSAGQLDAVSSGWLTEKYRELAARIRCC